MQIEIINWDKLNPRKDQITHHWFKLPNDVGLDPDLFGMSLEQKFIWVLLMCEASRNGAPCFHLNVEWFLRTRCVTEKSLMETIELLIERTKINVADSLLRKSVPREEKRREEKRREEEIRNAHENVSETLSMQIQKAYENYPRKIGKARGMTICKKEIRSKEDADLLLKAIERYAQHCASSGTKPEYIKHFSTFMASWRDWLDPEAGSVALPAPPEPEWMRRAREEEQNAN